MQKLRLFIASLCVLTPCVLTPCVLTSMGAQARAEPPAKTNGYAKPQLLADISELKATGSSRTLLVFDVREAAKFAAGHIKDSIHIDATAWGKAVGEEREASTWTERFASHGLNDDSQVIVVDDQRQRSAARIWWILKLWGFENAKVLNGGWSEVTQASIALEKGEPPAPKRGNFIAKHQTKALATKDELLALHKSGHLGKSGSGNLQLVDTRSEGEYCGTESSRSKRSGTIPGAKHLEWSDLLEADSARFKSPDKLKQLFVDAGVDVTQPAATFCQGGGRAAVVAFGLELLGSPEARNYYASWGEWGQCR